MTVAAENALDLLASLIGAEHVRESVEEINGTRAALEVAPASAEEAAAVLRLAAEHRLSVVPVGGLTKQSFGNLMPQVDVLLSTRRLTQVEYYDPGDLTFGVQAGATIAQIQQALSANHQFLPLDVMSPDRATIGGVLATNAHGPMKHFFGGVRDYCIGIEFATVDGKVVKGGGRVVKNVAGFDLMKLMIGSHGTLGVITSANFKVFPAFKATRTFVAAFPNLAGAIAFRDRVVAAPLTPVCLEIVSPQAQEYFGAAQEARNPDLYAPKAPLATRSEWRVYVRAAGSGRVLARYSRELTETKELSGEEEVVAWRAISDFEPRVMAQHHNAMVMHLHTAPASVPRALEAAEKAALDNTCTAAIIGRVGVGALIVAIIPLAIGPPSAMHYANAASALRAALPKDASAVVARCPLEAKSHFDVWGSSPTDLEMMRRVRAALDPHGILNRGRFLV